jgi:hypothetical protein
MDLQVSFTPLASQYHNPDNNSNQISVPKDDSSDVMEWMSTKNIEAISTGYDKRYEKPVKRKPVSLDRKTKEEYHARSKAWSSIKNCPKCNGTDLFKYHDTSYDRFFVKCRTVPSTVLKEIECLCRGQVYEPSSRAKSNGEIPLSQTVKSLEEYVDVIQDRLCGWGASM